MKIFQFSLFLIPDCVIFEIKEPGKKKMKGLFREYGVEGKKMALSLWTSNGVFSNQRLSPVASFSNKKILLKTQN
jgi:hypothetical protein